MSTPTSPDQPKREPAVEYIHTKNFPAILRECNLSLAVTTYQAQRILMFSPRGPEKLFMLMRVFDRPTGLALCPGKLGPGKLAIYSLNKVWEFQAPSVIPQVSNET